MPHRKRECRACRGEYQPHNKRDVGLELCPGCRMDDAVKTFPGREKSRPPRRECDVCKSEFQPLQDEHRACPSCRKLTGHERRTDYDGYTGGPDVPVAPMHDSAPLRQAVFDLETFGLDRGWGVLMMGVILVHGGGEPEWYEFDLTQSSTWPDRRTDDHELGAKILKVLSGCHVAFAHNGRNFDIPWLNSVALRYDMPPLNIKLVDPVQVARRKYRIGSNTLSALANFLSLPEGKMPLPPDCWREALLNNDPESWALLRERCRSDVRLLNSVASRVTRDVGMIDYNGSAWR